MKPYAQFMAGLIFLALMTAALPQSAGAGTPVEISTLEQLQHIGDDATTMAGHYILINDIDASDTQNWNNESGTPKGIAPIGNNFSFWFTGSFDGRGHVITNLFINRPDDTVGLFGFAGSGCMISNLGLANVMITGRQIVGGLAGRTYYSTLTGCYSTGAVSGTNWVGGLVGYNDCTSITNSYSTCAVNGAINIGGLAGYNNCVYASITNCYSTGTVTGSTVGGLVGLNDNGASVSARRGLGVKSLT